MPAIVPVEGEASTRRLIDAAARLTTDGDQTAFERAYRAWINAHHVVAGKSPDERQAKVRLLLLAMLNGRDLGGALSIMLRFARHSIGELGPVTMADDGDVLRITMARMQRPGVAGLIGELWALAFHRSQLEFLAGRALPGMQGMVRHEALLDPHVEACLFGPPVRHAAATLSLCLPRRHLTLPILASAEQVSSFVHSLLPSGSGSARSPVELAALVEAMLRVDILRSPDDVGVQSEVARRIGCSVATLRRRLAQEGDSFRAIHARVRDELAKHWLGESRLPLAMIAERLGYADGYAFRRAFLRMNGRSPTAYRQEWKRSA